MRSFVLAAALAVLAGTASVAKATEIAACPFDDTRASDDVELHSDASDFFDGAGVVAAYSIIGAPVPSLAVNYAQIDGTSEAAAVAMDDYVAFTVTPHAGYELDLTNMTYASNAGTSLFGPVTFFVRSSVDGYAVTLGSVTRTSQFFSGSTVDLSGAWFQNLTTATTFHIYLYDGGKDSTADAGRVDALALHGTVLVVPEPSALLLLAGMGAAAGLARRTRRRTQ